MLGKLRPRSIYDVMAAVACFAALAGGTAYAANTIRTGDIVDNEVYSADVRNDNLSGGGLASGDIQNGAMTTLEIRDDNQPFGGLLAEDLGPGSVGSSEVVDNSLGASDVVEESMLFNNTLNASDIGPGAVGSSEVADNSLTGTDINEGSLSLPPSTTGAIVGQGNVSFGSTFAKVTSRSLPAGSYAIAATANLQITAGGSSGDNSQNDTACELRNTNGAFIGGGRDRRVYPHQQITTVSLSMNGGVQVPAGGGEVGLYCRTQSEFLGQVADGQMMILKLDGFF